MLAGRSRMRLFNTLKNGGYGLGHNFGHGKENLSFNAVSPHDVGVFFVDQIF